MVRARINSFQSDTVPWKADLDAAAGCGGLMGTGSWVTSRVHQRIDSLWRLWHPVRVMGRSSHGIRSTQACPTTHPWRINNSWCFTFSTASFFFWNKCTCKKIWWFHLSFTLKSLSYSLIYFVFIMSYIIYTWVACGRFLCHQIK